MTVNLRHVRPMFRESLILVRFNFKDELHFNHTKSFNVRCKVEEFSWKLRNSQQFSVLLCNFSLFQGSKDSAKIRKSTRK